MPINSGYTFPILDSLGNPTTTSVDFATMFIPQSLYTNNLVYSWGRNEFGQLGNGNTTYYSSPVQVGSLTNWKRVSGSQSSFSSFTKTDGTLWSVGRNSRGQLGLGNVAPYSSPIQIGSLTNWSQVALGGTHMVAIKTDGTLWAWGNNDSGQLGTGSLSPNRYSSPIQVGSLTNWKQVSCGYRSVTAIKTDGTLWTWGLSPYGSYSSPIQVGSLTDWGEVACGYVNDFAIKTDGSLWAWGDNRYGQIGNGNITSYSSPIQIGALTNWKQVSCSYHTVAVKTDGSLWAWGFNAYGQLGNGNTTYYSSPIQVGSLTNWKQVSCSYHTVAVKTDGSLWAWGRNNVGQLGNGNITNYSSPIQIGSLTNWSQVECGYNNTLSISNRY